MSNNQRKKQAAAAHNAARAQRQGQPDISDVRERVSKEIHLADTLDTGERHSRMYEIAENNPLKGKQGECCNVTQCQKPQSADYFNNGTDAWYCVECATDIHHANRFDDFVLFDQLQAPPIVR